MAIYGIKTERIANTLAGLTLIFLANTAIADTLITEKQRFSMKDFETTSGVVLAEIQIGWEAYGKLNAAKDNAVLVPHYVLGSSHAAGKYAETDKYTGYWDSIIGPGKAIDTNRFYVISSDSLANTNVKDPNVFTTGPASLDPKTNKPYGITFPVITIRDFVNAQHALLKSLSITKLHAVAGTSMGALQALEWSSAYPDMVPRVVAVTGIAEADGLIIAELEKWAMPIKDDPNWNKGDYYDKDEPVKGLTKSMRSIVMIAHHGYIYDRRFKDKMNDDPAPRESILNDFKINTWLNNYAAYRAGKADANHVLYYIRANQLFRLGHKKTLAEGIAPIKAKLLLLPAKNDMLFPLYHMKNFYTQLLIQKKDVIYDEIEGPWGHLDGIYAVATKADMIKKFLEE